MQAYGEADPSTAPMPPAYAQPAPAPAQHADPRMTQGHGRGDHHNQKNFPGTQPGLRAST
ncbi:MAG: hypothetical protein ABJA34_09520 [Pseudonocardiales bacterium]